ncbi:hypothetical protein Aperf_G00000063957 [Anoplocephala perfoliata]
MASNSQELFEFPLAGKRVFLHLNRPNQLTRILTKLRASVRPFFDGHVDCVIYNPAPMQSSTPTTENIQTSSPLTRGRAMVLAATQGSSPTHRDVISQARSLGIQLITLNEVIGWILDLPERVLLDVYNDTGEDELRSDSFDPEVDRLLNVRLLKPPAVKIVDKKSTFRPLFAEETNFMQNLWPSIRELIPSSSQFADRPCVPLRTTTEEIRDSPTSLVPRSRSLSSRQHHPVSNVITSPSKPNISATLSVEITSARNYSRFLPKRAESPSHGPGRPTGSYRRSQSNPRHRKHEEPHEPSGHCEACCVHYKNLYEHLNSSEHMEFANNPENFRGIDEALSSFQGFQQDLLKYMQSLGNQPSTRAETSAQTGMATPSQVEMVSAVPAVDVLPLPQPLTSFVSKNRSPAFDFPSPPQLRPLFPPPEPPGFRHLFIEEDPSTPDPATGIAALDIFQIERDSARLQWSSSLDHGRPDLISNPPVSQAASRQVPSASQQDLTLTSFSAANILGLPDAPPAPQSPRDFSSSTSERIDSRFRSCRECGKIHIPTSLDSDLELKCESGGSTCRTKDEQTLTPRSPAILNSNIPLSSNVRRRRHINRRRLLSSRNKTKASFFPCAVCKRNVTYGNWSVLCSACGLWMRQFLPGRDIDSFCPRSHSNPHCTELDQESTNQNTGPHCFPLSENVQSFERSGAEQQENSTHHSPILENEVLERSSNDVHVYRSPIFDEETRIRSEQASERSPATCSPPQISPTLTHEFRQYALHVDESGANSPAKVHMDSTYESNDDGRDLSVLHPQGSPILEEEDDEKEEDDEEEEEEEDDDNTLPMVWEQDPAEIPLYYYSEPLVSLEATPIKGEVPSNFEDYDGLSETSGDISIQAALLCLRGPVSPEVTGLAGPRETEEEQERQRSRVPRRAFLVAREAIGLTTQALFTPSQLTSDRAFFRSVNKEGNRRAQYTITSPVQAIKRRRLFIHDSTESSSDKENTVVCVNSDLSSSTENYRFWSSTMQ